MQKLKIVGKKSHPFLKFLPASVCISNNMLYVLSCIVEQWLLLQGHGIKSQPGEFFRVEFQFEKWFHNTRPQKSLFCLTNALKVISCVLLFKMEYLQHKVLQQTDHNRYKWWRWFRTKKKDERWVDGWTKRWNFNSKHPNSCFFCISSVITLFLHFSCYYKNTVKNCFKSKKDVNSFSFKVILYITNK